VIMNRSRATIRCDSMREAISTTFAVVVAR